MFLSGAKTRGEVQAVSAAVRIPLFLGGTTGELADLEFLSAHNVKVALQGHAPFSAAVQAVYDTLKALRDGVPPRELKNIASSELMRQVTRADDYQRWTKDYLDGV
jgi:carboxyvinyl-carboxyphosphonate phosphorylmutase